jgi:hypothetical protein
MMQGQIGSAELPASTEGYCVLRSAAPGGRLSTDPKRTSVRTTDYPRRQTICAGIMSALVELDRP